MIFPDKYLLFDIVFPAFHVLVFIIEISKLLIEEKNLSPC